MTIDSDRPDYPGFSSFRETSEQPDRPEGASRPEPDSGPAPASTWSSPVTNGQAENETHAPSEQAASSVAVSPGHNGSGTTSTHIEEPHATITAMRSDDADGLALPDDLTEKLPGFTRPASDCINKARRIARELNHSSVSAAHLALALTLDHRPSRRLRDQGVDVDHVREAAVRNLARFNFVYSSGASTVGDSRAAPDLADILEIATRFAQEKDDEEEINISDLLDAFRKSGSGLKLIYEVPEASDQVPAVIRRVEQGVAQQLDRLFAEMERRLQPSPQLDHVIDELERRLFALPHIDQSLADMESRLLAQTEERLSALLNSAGAELGQELRTLRDLNGQLREYVIQLERTTRSTNQGGWWPVR